MKSKELKLFNGGADGRGAHYYIAAYSVRDAARLMTAADRKLHGGKYEITDLDISRNVREINTYFSKNCWGNKMDGVVPERGIWYAPAIEGGHEGKPERVELEI